MPTTDVVVIGGGQAGLAVSRLLTELGLDHVVLERGAVAHRWRTRGWDSLSLLTPRWLSRLPHRTWTGPDPDGYMSRAEVVAYLRDYARSFAAPVLEHTEVVDVRESLGRLAVTTTAGRWVADDVVLATGHCAAPFVPDLAAGLVGVVQVSADEYRRPGALPDGGVLVVGASASGTQIADELRAAGRDVVLAAGHHTRVPRRYRGRDILAWLEATGALDRPRTSLPAPSDPPKEPSLQLVGAEPARELDLRSLQDRGVAVVGRLTGTTGRRVRLARDLPVTAAAADDRLRRLLRRIDVLADAVGAPEDRAPVRGVRTSDTPTEIDLAARGITSVVWATGYRRAYPWLHLPVLDADGEIRQDGGRTPVPGLFVVGTAWQTRRSSALLDGVRHDAALVAAAVADRHRRGAGSRDLLLAGVSAS